MSNHAFARPVERSARGRETPIGAHDAVLTLGEDGAITKASAGAEALFGYRSEGEILGRHISFLLPELARLPLVRDGVVNSRLAFLCQVGKRFTAARREGWAFFAELFIHKVEGSSDGPLLLTVRPAGSARLTADPSLAQHLKLEEVSLTEP